MERGVLVIHIPLAGYYQSLVFLSEIPVEVLPALIFFAYCKIKILLYVTAAEVYGPGPGGIGRNCAVL